MHSDDAPADDPNRRLPCCRHQSPHRGVPATSPTEIVERGFAVEGTFDEIDDPVLLGPDGLPVRTWQEGYPYAERMSRHDYEEQKRALQIELLKAQDWIKETGYKLVLVFEGRDAAGKGGTIKRFRDTLTLVAPTWWRSASRHRGSRANGSSSVTSGTCRRGARSASSIGRGTTGRSSSR